jgi:SAM-dependent methyltransferase
VSVDVCRLCGRSATKAVLTLEKIPRNIQRLLRDEELPADGPTQMTVLECEACGFVQAAVSLGSDYYDDYVMGTSHSPQMQRYQAGQATDFVRRFKLEGKSVVETGCGDGSFMGHLASAGARPVGVEPSWRFRDLALAHGYDVQDGYVTAARALGGAPFDGFVCRQVLEHVPTIHDFLQGVRRNVRPEAFGLVEVPRLEKALIDGRYYDFFPDHVNYFSERTLRVALELNGFEVLEIAGGMSEEYNVAIVKTPATCRVSQLQAMAESLSREIEEFIGRHLAAKRSVAIWGAGGKGLSVMSLADVSGVDLLIDSDPLKQGLFSPVSHLRVHSPEVLLTRPVDVLIVTALAYKTEILSMLRDRYRFKGQVAVLGENLEIVSI